MRRRKGKIAAIAVLVGGTGLAMLFYRPSHTPPDSARSDIRHRADDGPRLLMEVRSATPPAATVPLEPVQLPSEVPPASISGLPLFEASDPAVPRLARTYPTTIEKPLPPATETSHRVKDGDTLPALAARYLGDASRSDEIFQRNRDVLSSADLLPIGAVLKIPAR